MNFRHMSLAVVAASLVVSPAVAGKKGEMTPLAIQALQSKEFETTPRVLFRSVVSVFQDLGYTIDTADFDSGLVTATSATKNKTNFWNALGGVSASGNTRATATVEELANGRSSVRLNFVSTKSSSGAWGQSHRSDKPILDAKVYQIAFEKIDEALFVRQATNAPPAASQPVSAPSTSLTAPAQSSATIAGAQVVQSVADQAAVKPVPSSAAPDSIDLGGGVRLVQSKTLSGYCISAPPGYQGTGSVNRPTVSEARPLCK